MLIARHGGSSHYLRPDQIYRTGVIQPITGFSPHQDVMAVAAQFTQGPYAFQAGNMSAVNAKAQAGVSGPRITLMGPPLALFGATSNIGFMRRAWLRFQAWRSAKKAQAFMAAGGGLGFTPYGPQAWAGGRVVPGASERTGLLIAMAQAHQPSVIGQNNTDAIMARWNFMRSPTR